MGSYCTFEANTKYLIDIDVEIPAEAPTGNLDLELYVKDGI